VLSDVLGKTRTLLLGLACFAFIPLAYLLVSTYQALVAVRFLHGFATAIYGPVSMALIVGLAGARRAEMLSWFSAITITGNLLGAPLGGLLLTQMASGAEAHLVHFHLVYGVVAACGMASLGIGLWVMRGRGPEPGTVTGHSLAAVLAQFKAGAREILLDRRVLLTSNLEGVQNLSLGALEAFLPIYAVQICGLSPFQAGLLWGVQIIATIASKPLLGRVSDRYGREPLLFWGMWTCALPFALIPWFQNLGALVALAALFGLGEAVVTSSAAALVADFCREDHLGSAMGAFGTIFDVGHAAGPLLAGALIGLAGDFRAPFAIIAAILIMAALAFKVGVRR
jgi:DHA1 family multidrug resistance protein-like MFS transporter